MDRREHLNDADTALATAMRGLASQMWTGFPGIVKSYDPTTNTVKVQPAIKAIQVKPGANGDNTLSHVSMPLLVDCPVMFQSGGGGGGVVLTTPITQGDECWVNIADRCIDGWWQSGGEQQQMERRIHDLSDGFAFIGPWSKPKVPGNISTTTAQLRSFDGSTYAEVDPAGQKVNIVAPGGAFITANTHITGTLHVTGQITCDADVVANGISLDNHVHSDPQGGDTGAPTG